MSDGFKKFCAVCLAVNVVLGIIAFGYIAYQFIGEFSILLTMLFILLLVLGYSAHNEELEKNFKKKKAFNSEIEPLLDDINELVK